MDRETPQFETKDSGKRIDYPSGMRRDIADNKPRYDLIPLAPLRRVAELYARGAIKYGDRNWQLANSPEELERFKASAYRHFMQWANGEVDEDHMSAVVFNLFAYEVTKEKLGEIDDRDDLQKLLHPKPLMSTQSIIDDLPDGADTYSLSEHGTTLSKLDA